MFKKYCEIFILISLSFIVFSCSSAKRFSNDNNENSESDNYLNTIAIGKASYYANEFHGKNTSNGEVYNMNDLTAAHPFYPFNTIVKVTNLSNEKSVIVRINDRMPDFKGRIIDLSLAAAKKIGMVNSGVQKVKIEVIKWGKN